MADHHQFPSSHRRSCPLQPPASNPRYKWSTIHCSLCHRAPHSWDLRCMHLPPHLESALHHPSSAGAPHHTSRPVSFHNQTLCFLHLSPVMTHWRHFALRRPSPCRRFGSLRWFLRWILSFSARRPHSWFAAGCHPHRSNCSWSNRSKNSTGNPCKSWRSCAFRTEHRSPLLHTRQAFGSPGCDFACRCNMVHNLSTVTSRWFHNQKDKTRCCKPQFRCCFLHTSCQGPQPAQRYSGFGCKDHLHSWQNKCPRRSNRTTCNPRRSCCRVSAPQSLHMVFHHFSPPG
mmetsp:Transcript_956/g.1531  ORF Transcript_956/g.1531 Transcript_956/m.1531 type:complete len:286 (-) Transcript_956:62-919(-)